MHAHVKAPSASVHAALVWQLLDPSAIEGRGQSPLQLRPSVSGPVSMRIQHRWVLEVLGADQLTKVVQPGDCRRTSCVLPSKPGDCLSMTFPGQSLALGRLTNAGLTCQVRAEHCWALYSKLIFVSPTFASHVGSMSLSLPAFLLLFSLVLRLDSQVCK